MEPSADVNDPDSIVQPFARLLRAMDETEVPTSRPALSRHLEAFGLNLLGSALKLEHVTRVIENLKLINTDHLSRTVSVDVDLEKLTVLQRAILSSYDSNLSSGGVAHGDDRRQRIWVPIARHSREDLAPVVVRNASSDVVPRLTQNAAAAAIAAGISRLFRTEIRAHTVEVAASGIRNQAGWLIETAIARLVDYGIHGREQPVGATKSGGDPVRAVAREALTGMELNQARHYSELLMTACREYYLAVLLPLGESHHFLTYEAPLIPAVRSTTARRRSITALLPFSTEFTVDYATQIPRSVGSYHVTVDVPEEIDVRRFILSSDAERAAVTELTKRIRSLERSHQDLVASVVHQECNEISSTLEVLGRRRQLDIDGFEYYLHNRNLLGRRTRERINERETGRTFRVSDLDATFLPTDRTTDPTWRVAALANLAEWIDESQLGIDVSTDNDPRENGAHAQWRSKPLRVERPGVEPVEARVFLALADEPPALVESVARMVGALALVVIGVFIAVSIGAAFEAAKEQGTPPPAICTTPDVQPTQGRPIVLDCQKESTKDTFGVAQADAAVAVLLIVPGILLSRLEIQATHSVLGRLRRFPQLVAYLSVAITTILALTIAGANNDPDALRPAFLTAAGALVTLFMLCGLERAARYRRRQRLVPASDTIPPWLGEEFGNVNAAGNPAWTRTIRPDAYFDAIRPVPNITRVADRSYEEQAARRGTTFGSRRSFADEDETTAWRSGESPARLADVGARSIGREHTYSELMICHSASAIPLTERADETVITAVNGSAVNVQVLSGTAHDVSQYHALRTRSNSLGSDEEGHWSVRQPLAPAKIRDDSIELDLLAVIPQRDVRAAETEAMAFLDEVLSGVRDQPEQGGDPDTGAFGVVPILVLWPAVAPSGSNNDDGPLPATGRCLRMTFLVNHRQHRARLIFESKVAEYSQARGIEIWHASRAPQAGQGDWRRLPADLAAVGRSARSQGRRETILITFVARSGKEGTGLLTDVVKVMADRRAQVLGVTATAIGQFAFVHVQLARTMSPRRLGPRRYRPNAYDSITSTVNHLIADGWLDGPAMRATTVDIFGACIGPLSAYTTGPEVDRSRVTLWADWEFPDGPIRDHEVATLLIEECSILGAAEIRFWRSRVGSDDRVRGRAKLAVTLTVALDKGQRAGNEAKAMQSRVLARLRRSLSNTNPLDIFVHVVWRESWLERRRGS